MISNYHSASEAPGSDYYTIAGSDDDVAAAHQKDHKPSSNSKNAKTHRLRSSRRIFGKFGRGRVNGKDSSNESSADTTASSAQSTGESTNSSGFSGITRTMEMQDKKELLSTQRGISSNQSTTSSLNYSTDESFGQLQGYMYSKNSPSSQYSCEYSTDGSQLEGSKLIEDSPKQASLLGMYNESESEDEEEPFDMLVQPALSPTTSTASSNGDHEKENDHDDAKEEEVEFQKKKEPSTNLPMRTRYNQQTAAAAAVEIDSKSESSRKRSSSTTASSTKHKKNVNSRGIRDEFTEWCKYVPDAVPRSLSNFKTFLQPFLCGVI